MEPPRASLAGCRRPLDVTSAFHSITSTSARISTASYLCAPASKQRPGHSRHPEVPRASAGCRLKTEAARASAELGSNK